MTAWLSFVQTLIGAIPAIVKLVRAGRNPADIKLGEVISTDALKTLESARDDAQSFIDNG